MLLRRGEITFPSDDKRWRIVNATMRRHGYRSDGLIETLHSVQEAFGFLDGDALHFVSQSLRVPLSRAYGVATFYHFFNLKPQGEHTCVVCTGTACYIKGAAEIIERIEDAYRVQPGHTSPDGKLSLMTARCVGACGLAPVAVLDGEVAGRLETESALVRVKELVDHDAG
ncbi:MAG: bidirectional hydrogenase complex protein HoxE [Chloroflexi bacterium]|nr:bidirectional hydrogenase complex protein HoxE [Chloroflexota bacterium]